MLLACQWCSNIIVSITQAIDRLAHVDQVINDPE